MTSFSRPSRGDFELVVFDCDGVTPAERLAGPGATVFHDMRQLPELVAAGRPA